MLIFNTASVWEKIENIENSCEEALKLTTPSVDVPEEPARDVIILHPKDHPAKKGFSTILNKPGIPVS